MTWVTSQDDSNWLAMRDNKFAASFAYSPLLAFTTFPVLTTSPPDLTCQK